MDLRLEGLMVYWDFSGLKGLGCWVRVLSLGALRALRVKGLRM